MSGGGGAGGNLKAGGGGGGKARGSWEDLRKEVGVQSDHTIKRINIKTHDPNLTLKSGL